MYAKYRQQTDEQIKRDIAKNLKALDTLLNAAIEKCLKDQLNIVAEYYQNLLKTVYQRLPYDVEAIDKLSAENRRTELIGVAVNVENFRAGGLSAAIRRAGRSLRVTDSEENLLKKFINLNNKLLGLIKKAIAFHRQRQRAFMIDLHIWVSDGQQ